MLAGVWYPRHVKLYEGHLNLTKKAWRNKALLMNLTWLFTKEEEQQVKFYQKPHMTVGKRKLDVLSPNYS